MTGTDQLISEAMVFVENLFATYCDESFVFHNLEHTQNVLKRSLEIAVKYEIAGEELAIVSLAALFHDTGYLFVQPPLHEQKSVEIFQKFAKPFSLSDYFLNGVEACIMATKFPTNPSTLLQKIICDADTYHLGTSDFTIFNSRVCAEFDVRNVLRGEHEFYTKTIELLKKHTYYTAYCQELLMPVKEKNIHDLIVRHQIGEDDIEKKPAS